MKTTVNTIIKQRGIFKMNNEIMKQIKLSGGVILLTELQEHLINEIMMKFVHDEITMCSALVEIDSIINGCGANEFTRN